MKPVSQTKIAIPLISTSPKVLCFLGTFRRLREAANPAGNLKREAFSVPFDPIKLHDRSLDIVDYGSYRVLANEEMEAKFSHDRSTFYGSKSDAFPEVSFRMMHFARGGDGKRGFTKNPNKKPNFKKGLRVDDGLMELFRDMAELSDEEIFEAWGLEIDTSEFDIW